MYDKYSNVHVGYDNWFGKNLNGIINKNIMTPRPEFAKGKSLTTAVYSRLHKTVTYKKNIRKLRDISI